MRWPFAHIQKWLKTRLRLNSEQSNTISEFMNGSFFPDFIDLLFLDILHKCTHIIYCLSPNFRGKNIQSFTNKYDAGYRFFIESPYKLRKFFSISSYWDFYHEWMLGIIKCFFFCMYWDDHVFFFCYLYYSIKIILQWLTFRN